MLQVEVYRQTSWQTVWCLLQETSISVGVNYAKICHLNKNHKNPALPLRRLPWKEDEKWNMLVATSSNRWAGSCPHLEILEACSYLLHCLSALIMGPISDEMIKPDAATGIL